MAATALFVLMKVFSRSESVRLYSHAHEKQSSVARAGQAALSALVLAGARSIAKGSRKHAVSLLLNLGQLTPCVKKHTIV